MAIITTDSGISPLKRDYSRFVPALINGNSTYLDGKISNEEILNRMKNGEEFKTSSPTYAMYEDTFIELLKNSDDDIIHLSMSSGISSGSYEMANLVARNLSDRIRIIDTKQASVGGTLINEVAENLANKGLSTEDIISNLESIKNRIETSFVVPDPRGFIRSGRDKSEVINKLKLTYVNLKIKRNYKFIVKFNDGNLYNDGNFRMKEDFFKPLLDNYLNNLEDYDPNYIVIGSVLEDKISMADTKKYIESYDYFKSVIVKNMPGVVATYGCNDLCGVSLVKKMK